MRITPLMVTAILFFQSASFAENKTPPAPIQKKTDSNQIAPNSEQKKSDSLELDPEKAENQFLNSLDYPELQVVPKASERVQMDAAQEEENGYMMFWPFHVASGTTMLVALMHKNKFKPEKENDENYRRNVDFSVNAAAGLSAAWFAFTYFVSENEPYNGALTKINAIKGKDKKSLLLKERIAEEAMQKPAELIKMMAYMSTLTNLIAAGGLMDTVSSDYNVYAGLAILTSFVPLIFKNKYVENYEKQMEYKRKIYAPVVYTDFYRPTQTASWSPRLVMEWRF